MNSKQCPQDATSYVKVVKDYGGKMNKGTPPEGKEGKEKTESLNIGLKGGKTHMSGRNYAGPQPPDVSSSEGQKKDIGKYAKGGGSNHMFQQGQLAANPQAPGVSGHTTSGDDKFAKGGNTKMFGYRGSQPAKPA